MRIVAGTFGGRRLKAPPGNRVRPTSDKVREALFSILGETVVGASVLDLYAGTGALGLEALSRGAVSAVFVEQSAPVRRVLQENVAALELSEACMIRTGRVPGALQTLTDFGVPFDIVFADPPYERGQTERLLKSEALVDLVAANAQLVVELRKTESPNPGLWNPGPRRVYGDTSLWFLTPRGQEV